ncbi:MAG TPA: GFA family protein [Elusimicrobiota bacterium]|nr:GFA family protein [Elusimicrobiota bacterium]
MKTGSGDGSCVCGAVRFTVSFPSRFCSHCHCDNCRRAHSAAFVTYLGFKSAQVRVRAGRNALAEYAYSYKLKGKSITSRRRFCRKCGTQLFFESSRWPGEIHVPLAAIPRGADRAPQLHFYFDHRPAWMIPVNDRLPKYGGKTGGEKIRSASN